MKDVLAKLEELEKQLRVEPWRLSAGIQSGERYFVDMRGFNICEFPLRSDEPQRHVQRTTMLFMVELFNAWPQIKATLEQRLRVVPSRGDSQ